MTTRVLFAGLLLSSLAGLADAQTDRYPPDRVFSYYDRDKNGRLDGREYERFSSELKEAVRAVRLDFRRGVDQDTFIRAWPKLTGEMRARRDREASRRDDRRGPDLMAVRFRGQKVAHECTLTDPHVWTNKKVNTEKQLNFILKKLESREGLRIIPNKKKLQAKIKFLQQYLEG